MIKDTIKLDINGRLFPLWVMENFKQYILPEIKKTDIDPCDIDQTEELTLYQKFIGHFLNYQSPFKDMLIYHGVGSGKTNTTINIYNVLFNYTPKWNVFLLIPAALHDDPWIKDIKKWMVKDNFEKRFANIIFIHYDSPHADTDFLEKVRKADSSKSSIFIIEESHRFITNVYNNITKKKGKRAMVIYDYIKEEKKENSNTRILLLSATPIVNQPFEYSLIFNLLRPDILPSSEAMFNHLFISSSTYSTLDQNNKNMFQRRIMGLVSYYIGATPDKYAQKNIHYVSIQMEKHQQEVYDFLENLENKKNNKLAGKRPTKKIDTKSTYMAYTRQACNFVFPNISNKVNGENRPRPYMFNVSDKEADILLVDNTEKKDALKVNKNVNNYINELNNYINEFNNYITNIKNNNYKESLDNDIKVFKKEYECNFTKFYESKYQKSKLFLKLYDSSPKFIQIIFNIFSTKGTVLVYSNYVDMEGLRLFKLYLEYFGFIGLARDKNFQPNNETQKYDNFRYCEFHGDIDRETRVNHKNIFNDSNNKYGKYCKIIMISPAGSEGISLKNVRQVHIIEPYWNEVRIEQVIGRALRFCHHKDLPMDERIVDVYRYKMIRKNNKTTTDQLIEDLARKKSNLLVSFNEAVKEVAIDCDLFKNHNMMGSKYNCFKFNEESLFDNPVNAAYDSNIENDINNNNGLNSIDSILLTIKVRKIKAVKIIATDQYSEFKYYWLYDKSGVIYDYELNYPVGKLLKNSIDTYTIINDDLYVIDYMISIPSIKQF